MKDVTSLLRMASDPLFDLCEVYVRLGAQNGGFGDADLKRRPAVRPAYFLELATTRGRGCPGGECDRASAQSFRKHLDFY